MNVFARYPKGGRELLGRPKSGNGTCRTGYGLALQRLTGESGCVYCGINLVDSYHHWLLMSIDHVVPSGEARRVGIGPEFSEDAINLVLCCSGCNGFGNRYRCAIEPREAWTLDEFLSLRDEVFAERCAQIAARRVAEIATFESRPWVMPARNEPFLVPTTDIREDRDVSKGVTPLMHTFKDDDAGYVAWIDANPHGFVVNSFRRPTPDYLVLHKATCKFISRMTPEPIRWTSGDYIKTCAGDLGELERWARDATGGPPSPCAMCKPV